MLLRQGFEVFIREKILDDCTPSTITFYKYSVKKLISFIGDQEDDLLVTGLHQYIQPYFLSLKDNPNLSPHSYNTFIRGVKVFTRFLFSEGYIEKQIKLPKIRKLDTNIKPLSPDSIRKILTRFDVNTFEGLRDKTIFSLFLDTGIRLSELCGIQLHDLDLDEGYITIYGKGRKQRYVPIGKGLKKLLWIYIKQRNRFVHQGDENLIISRKGVGITPYGIQTLFRRVRKGLGWNKLNPHLMRHSFSVNYINNGGDSFSLQRILGHSTQEMTSKYVNLSTTNIKTQHSRYSPIDRL
jgi:site-specific recombinase XerD